MIARGENRTRAADFRIGPARVEGDPELVFLDTERPSHRGGGVRGRDAGTEDLENVSAKIVERR